MRADYRVLFDSCVLANFGVCDLFLRLAERPRLINPHWSAEILEEVHRTHTIKLGWPKELADSYQSEVRNAFPEAEISGYEKLISGLENDSKDRHVLAAAIRGNCQLLITFNLKHFPAESAAPWGVEVAHPQDYLIVLYEMDPQLVMRRLGEIAGRRDMDTEDVLIKLGKSVPKFSQKVLDEIGA